jgi:hypothetical protein
MAKITFNTNNSNNDNPHSINDVIVGSNELSVTENNPNLDKVKLKKQENIRLVLGDTSSKSFSVGAQGAVGPTGATGSVPDFRVTKYFYGDIVPIDGNTGDKWFWTKGGIEFTYINLKWLQLYPVVGR